MKFKFWFGGKERQQLHHKIEVKESELKYVNGQLSENKAKYEAEIVRLKKENRALMCRLEETLCKLSDAEKKLSAASVAEKTSIPVEKKSSNPKQGNKSSKNKG